MLRITADQRDNFDALAQDVFLQRLVDYLCEDGSGELKFFPAPQRLVITSHLVSRTRAWGFEWESSIGLLCDLMLSIAPNLDQQPDIGRMLHTSSDADLEVKLATISSSAWEQAEAIRQFSPAWASPELDGAEPWDVFDACMSVAAWDVPQNARPALRKDAAQGVEALGLARTMDGFCVAALWAHLYGAKRDTAPWLKQITARQMKAETRVEALRARIMLDHARMV